MTDSPAGTELRVDTLGDSDRDALHRLVATDPIVNAVVAARLELPIALSSRRFGGTMIGARAADGRLRGAAFHGGNLLPVGGEPAEWAALAAHVAAQPRVTTSIVGRADAVAGLWHGLAPGWGRPRAIRERQPLLMTAGPVVDAPGFTALRAITEADLDAYLPASAAMFTEELGVSPYATADADRYRARVREIIRDGRAFGVLDRYGEVIFKADFGTVSAHTCQVQGVWVRPDRRGQGLGTAAFAAVLRRALAVAPTASLYVNDFNEPALRLYARLGLEQVATLSTVLL